MACWDEVGVMNEWKAMKRSTEDRCVGTISMAVS